jgi:hypothetical protein
MNKQGNWWLHALVHYDPWGEVLHMHRVTGEISIHRATPKVSRASICTCAGLVLVWGVRGCRVAPAQCLGLRQ